MKRFSRKGKCEGPRSFGRYISRVFLTHDDTVAYLRGRGKCHRAHTSGKGHGRRKNPKGRDGEPMKCHGCGADDHLVGQCPTEGKGKGSAPPHLRQYHAHHSHAHSFDRVPLRQQTHDDDGPLNLILSNTQNVLAQPDQQSTHFAG